MTTGEEYEMTGEEERHFRGEFQRGADELAEIHRQESKTHPWTGVEETWYIVDKHPSLNMFFEEGDEVLELSEDDCRKFALLHQKYLDSTLTDVERQTLEVYYLRYQIQKRRQHP